MSDFLGGHGATILSGAMPNVVSAATQREGFANEYEGALILGQYDNGYAAVIYLDSVPEPKVVTDFSAEAPNTGIAPYWFELLHYTPVRIDLGNLLTTVTQEVEVYNSYRNQSHTFISATNNAGAGIEFDGLPALPTEMSAQSGEAFDVVVSVDGPPAILGTLDFVTDPASFSIPITGSRVVMFAWQPEAGITETLEWKTGIITATDGTEQRIAWRKNPRQQIQMTVRASEGSERRRMMTLLKGWQARVFGVPVWWEAQVLQAYAAAGETSVSIDTNYADYREGALMIIWSDSEVFDAVEIDTVGANSLTLTSPLVNSYDAGEALVMPLRLAQLQQSIPIQRFLNSLQDVNLDWLIRDNDVGDSFADTSTYPTHNGKVLLEDPNVADGPIPDDQFVRIEVFDADVGSFQQFSDWLAPVPVTVKGFYGGTPEAIWKVRRLVHALRGSQVSFYLPTYYFDLVPTTGLASASTALRVENTGYADYMVGQEPFVSIWIELTDGTTLTREVTDAEIVDSEEELLTVGEAWTEDVDLENISRISLLRLVRIADDRVEFLHAYPGNAQIRANVRGAP